MPVLPDFGQSGRFLFSMTIWNGLFLALHGMVLYIQYDYPVWLIFCPLNNLHKFLAECLDILLKIAYDYF